MCRRRTGIVNSVRTALFAVTTALSAMLLFSVQPLVAKALLPHFGGAPAVWVVCLVFFQTWLLAGYVLTDRLARCATPSRHVWIQVGILLVAAIGLPLAVPMPSELTAPAAPLISLLLVLMRTVGGPFLALSMMAPAVQRWFSSSEVPSAPHAARVYRLYAFSNAGSLLALLAYPLAVEPNFSLTQQRWGWTILYFVLVVCVFGCTYFVRTPALTAELTIDGGETVTAKQRAVWLGLSYLPSTLLASVTTYLTVEILPFPLLWTLPLALYLVTYIVAFSLASTAFVRRTCDRLAAAGLILSLGTVCTRVEMHFGLQLTLHLVTLTITALACHFHLAAARPAPRNLTNYYVWISVGGMLGGVFNAIVAPQCFDFIAEYPLSLIAATTLAGTLIPWRPKSLGMGLMTGLAAGGILALIAAGATSGVKSPEWGWLCVFLGVLPLAWWSPPMATPVSLTVLALCCLSSLNQRERLVLQTRSFFGVHRVMAGTTGKTYSLQHGNTTHGLQFRDDDLRIRRIPLTYYFPTGPIGQIFVGRREAAPYRVGVVGLGIGTLAAYGRPGDQFDFFEIDPVVRDLARDARYFTQLRDSAADCRVTLGDARQTLLAQPDGAYDLLVLDAFTGDSVPAHLLTEEAFRLYARKLQPNGLLALHISSRYLNLAPVVVAGAQSLGWEARVQFDSPITDDEFRRGKRASLWAACYPASERWPQVALDPRWDGPVSVPPRLWTDERSSLWPILQWK